MPISDLPQETARILTSSVALNDAVSVIKELVDNALDAQATTITIEISANTIDVIQVKDNGTGIGVDDRLLLCKRGCTSKIRTMDDLASLGGSFLGFRGEALFSACNVSGSVSITTRVEGEVAGSCIKYGPGGKMMHSSSASHLVGTTVRIQDFLTNIPVRKQAALKATSKTLNSVRKLLFAYAFARPEIRLSFKVLKAKNEKANWNYAPSTSNSTLSATAAKIVGTEVASQLLSHQPASENATTEYDMPSYKLEALLIDPKADTRKACNSEQFVSVDHRPVSADKDLMKDLCKIYKKFLRNVIPPENASSSSKPFLCLRIYCPAASYDINVEPAKDRVMFYKPSIVSDAFRNLLVSTYGDLVETTEPLSTSTGASGPSENHSFDVLLARKPESTSTTMPHSNAAGSNNGATPAIDVEDIVGDDDGALEDQALGQAADISDNPWSKARMNIRLYPQASTQDSDAIPHSRIGKAATEPGSLPAGQTPFTPHQTTVGTRGQLPAPRLSSDVPSPYQNPGPPIQRREAERDYRDESSPPGNSRGPTLLEGWMQAQARPPLAPGALSADTSQRAESNGQPSSIATSSSRTLASKSPSKVHSGEAHAQRTLVSPFKTPRLSQFPLPEQDRLGHGHPSSAGRVSVGLSESSLARAQRSDQELDDILEFERQKKAISQQRKHAMRASKAHRSDADPELSSDTVENTSISRRDQSVTELSQAPPREDYAGHLGEEAGLDQHSIEELRPARNYDHSAPHRSPSASARRLLTHSHLTDGPDEQVQDQPPTYMVDRNTRKIPETDSRAYLIRQRNVQDEDLQSNAAGLPRTGLKIRRAKSTRFPLEAIPKGEELYHLAVVIEHGVRHDEYTQGNPSRNLHEEAKYLASRDEYVQNGRIDGVQWASAGKAVLIWEKEVLTMLQKKYRPTSQSAIEAVAMDFNLSVAKSVKAHIDEHGL